MSEIVRKGPAAHQKVSASLKGITTLHEQFLDHSPDQRGIETTYIVECEEIIWGGWASKSRSVRITVRTTRK